MNRLAAEKEQELLTILREGAKPLDEEQACWDFAGIIDRLQMLDQNGNRPGIRRPWGTLRILAHEAAQTYHHHTGEVLGRTTTGGRGARFIMVLADAAGLTDPATEVTDPTTGLTTRSPYSLQKAADTVQAIQKGLNAKAKLKATGKFVKDDPLFHETDDDPSMHNEKVRADRIEPTRDDARGALLEPHQEGEDDDGWPIIEGYQPAPDRSRTVYDTFPRDVLDRLIAESAGGSKKPRKRKG